MCSIVDTYFIEIRDFHTEFHIKTFEIEFNILVSTKKTTFFNHIYYYTILFPITFIFITDGIMHKLNYSRGGNQFSSSLFGF